MLGPGFDSRLQSIQKFSQKFRNWKVERDPSTLVRTIKKLDEKNEVAPLFTQNSTSSSFIYPTQSRTYNPNARESDACRGSNSVWTTTLDIYTRACLPEYVVSTVLGPSPETTQDGTQIKDTPNPSKEIIISDPVGNRTRPAGLKGRDSTDHATVTD